MESFESEGSTFHFEAGGAGKSTGYSAAVPVGKRPAYRPPLGVPINAGKELGGKFTAVAVHLLILLLLLAPLTSAELRKEILGAGGAGPAGGGGGGSRGSGGGSRKTEQTTYVQVKPPPPPPKPSVVPQIKPPEVVKPPEVKPLVTPPPVDAKAESKAEVKNDLPPASSAAPMTGAGGGTGTDGSAGSGSGSGGGVGSGVGTGRGSGVGPGTGGGAGMIYPPTPTELFIPPMPPPSRIKGFELIAQFEVDSTGKVVSLDFNRTKDSGYNQKLESILKSVRFRPGVNGLGVAVRAKTQIVYTF